MSNQTPNDPNDQPRQFMGFQSPNYTMVPDELFDELLPDLSGAELKVLLYIIRRTFGFKRDSDTISINQMLHGITTRDGRVLDRGAGVSRRALLPALQSLREKNIILTTRQQSQDRGNEPTLYRLNVIEPSPREKTTPPVGEKLHQGGGAEIAPPLVQKLHLGLGAEIAPSPRCKNCTTQYTVKQETGEQETEPFEASKLRSAPSLDHEGSLGRSTPSGAPGGFSTPGDVLGSRAQPPPAPLPEPPPRSAAPAAEVQVQPVEKNEPAKSQREERPETASEDWQRIQFHIDQFRRELGDRATLRASTTRAYNLYLRSEVPIDLFIERLFQARVITQEHTATITAKGEDEAFKVSRKTKIPYFFGVLEELLGLLPPEEQTRRERLRARAVARVEAAKRGEQQAPKPKRGDGDQGDGGQRSGRNRDSEGPYAAYIEH